MAVIKAFTLGLMRVARGPYLVLILYLASLALSLPMAFAVKQLLEESVGQSLVAEKLLDSFDMGWYGEFSHQNPDGLAATFGPSVVGAFPVLDNLERLLDGELLTPAPALLTAGVAWLLLWAFLTGGILDRYAGLGAGGDSRSRFLARCGEYFFRFVRLLGLSLLLYVGLFKVVGGRLHTWVEEATRDTTEERIALLLTVAVYGVLALVLVIVKLAFDYAKIAMVVEGRKSAVLALLKGLRFVGSNPVKTLSLFLLLTLVGGGVILVYSQVAPGPGQKSMTTILLALVVSQLYLASRLVLKLWFLGAQTVLFQEVVDVKDRGGVGVESLPSAAPETA